MPFVTDDDVMAMLALEGSDGSFVGANLDNPGGRVFGGQLLAQLIGAAALSSPDKRVRSLHVAFPREGSLDEHVRYDVTSEKRGRSFDTWSVRASQGGQSIAAALISMSVDLGQFDEAAAGVARPGPEASVAVDLQLVPWETRACPGHDLFVTDRVDGEYAFWMRTAAGVEPGSWQSSALLAHVTDLTLIATALLSVEGWSIADAHRGLTTAVTTHTIWFHRPVAPDAWVLFDQRMRSVAGEVVVADGVVRGDDGTLLLSYAQESILRVKH